VVVVEKYTLDGTNTFISMKHKHKGHTHECCYHDYCSAGMTSKYTDLWNARGRGGLQRTRDHL